MIRYEYKVTPAPDRGVKRKNLKAAEDRFAAAVEDTINAQASDGWHYMRAETLPCEERKGLTGRETVYRNMLVFRRPIADPLIEDEAAPVTEDETPDTPDTPRTPELRARRSID